MSDNSFDEAFSKLDDTINSINSKLAQGKDMVSTYKKKLIDRLQALGEQINGIKGNLKSIPNLRDKLQKTQTDLEQKTNDLNTTQQKLEETQTELTNLTEEIKAKNKEIEDKTKEINELNSSNSDNKSQIDALNSEKDELIKQKAEAESNLKTAQTQIDGFIARLGAINETLLKQIEIIDNIYKELGEFDTDETVTNKFKEISDNIANIMNMINSPEVASGEGSSFEMGSSSSGEEGSGEEGFEEDGSKLTINDFKDLDNIKQLNPQQKNEMLQKYGNLSLDEKKDILQKLTLKVNPSLIKPIQNIIKQNDPAVINNALNQIINGNYVGGKRHRKRKTMKKRHRKTKKILRNGHKLRNGHALKGGYVYSSSKELDRTSSVINGLSKSRTRSKNNIKKNTRRRG